MKEIVVVIRPSFMKFCKDACQAALLNHILFWIAWNAKDKPQKTILAGEITYYATNEVLIECMAGAWSEKKVRSEVNALIDLGIIGRTKNQKWGTDRTKYFYFGQEQYAKLIELCKKFSICLAHIGLPKEIINLLVAFDKSIECPCTKQMVNLLNANGKSTECKEPNLPNAFGKNDHSNNKEYYKDNCKDNNERKKEPTQQKANVTTQERPSHSFVHSSSSSQKSSEETKPEIVFSPEAEQIYQFAEKLNLVALKRDENHRDSCNTLIEKGVTTFEKLESLKKFVKQIPFYADKTLNLKNLVKELPGWAQKQEKKPVMAGFRDLSAYNRTMQQQYSKPNVARSSYDDPDFVDDTFYGKNITDRKVAVPN